MKLTILGSGSPEAYARRASSGYLVSLGAERILFDCGGGVFDNLLRAGLAPADITHLVFSHLHSDHMLDYPRLVHAAWDEGAPPLKVYGPAPIAQITDAYFSKHGVLAHDLRARTELAPSQEVWLQRGGSLPRPWPQPQVSEIAAGDTINGDGWSIRSCRAPHAQPLLECLAFAIEAQGKKLVYSGDAGLCPQIEALAHNADLLLHWCYRLDGEPASAAMTAMTPPPSQIGALARRAGVRALVLTHFRKHMDAPANHTAAQQNATTAFGHPVAIAEDLQSIEI